MTVLAPLRTTTWRQVVAASRPRPRGRRRRRRGRRRRRARGRCPRAAGRTRRRAASGPPAGGRPPTSRPSSRASAAPRRRGRSAAASRLVRRREEQRGRARPWRGPAADPARRRARRARGRGSGRAPAPGRPPRRRPRAAPSSSPRRPWPRTAAGATRGRRASRARRRPGRPPGRRAARRPRSRASRRARGASRTSPCGRAVGRSGSSAAAIASSSGRRPGRQRLPSSAPRRRPSASRRPNPTGVAQPRSPSGRSAARRPPALGARRLGQLAQPLHPGEDPPLAIVEPLLDVGREEVSAAGRPDAERDRDRVVGFVGDRHRDPAHAELLGPRRGAAVEADGRLAGRQPLDLDVAPADAADAEPEDLATRPPSPPSGRRTSRAGRGRSAARPAVRTRFENRVAEALERRPDPLDLDDVDAELRGARRAPGRGSARPPRRPRGPAIPAPSPYSTVTDFARLRGWSTSVPRATATW